MSRFDPLCSCGCNMAVNPGRCFIKGHNTRAHIRVGPNKGRVMGDEQKEKIRATLKAKGIKPPGLKKGQAKPRSVESRLRSSIALKNSAAHKAHAERMKTARRGAGNPAWKGGTSLLPYPYTWTAEFKARVRNVQGKFCHVCWAKVNSRTYEMDVHHIDADKLNTADNNFIVLCHPCHQKITMGKWQLSIVDGDTGKQIAAVKNPDPDAWKRKIGDSLRGRPKSPEHREKLLISAALARAAKGRQLEAVQ